ALALRAHGALAVARRRRAQAAARRRAGAGPAAALRAAVLHTAVDERGGDRVVVAAARAHTGVAGVLREAARPADAGLIVLAGDELGAAALLGALHARVVRRIDGAAAPGARGAAGGRARG